MLLYKKACLDVILLVLLFVLPKTSHLFVFGGMLDELILVLLLLIVAVRLILFKKDLYAPWLVVGFVIYALFLIIYNELPLSHIMQIFISLKFLIIFLYFYTTPYKYNKGLFLGLIYFIVLIFFLSSIVTLLQFLAPATFNGYSPDGRGIGGVCASGVFFSRVHYSAFLVFFSIVLMSLRPSDNRIISVLIHYRYFFLILTLLLLFLTFDRKEILLGLFLLIFLFNDKVKGTNKLLFYLFLFVILCVGLFIFYEIFKQLNDATFTDKQIRLLMFFHAIDIFNYYFPFGSGPGTYGSIMSIKYQDVYEQFNVAKHIYLGYGNDVRGPIFDLFLVGMLAEYGTGLLLLLLLLYKIGFKHFNTQLNCFINIKKVKKTTILQVVVISLFVPVLINWYGILVFAFLGLISKKERRRYVSKSH